MSEHERFLAEEHTTTDELYPLHCPECGYIATTAAGDACPTVQALDGDA